MRNAATLNTATMMEMFSLDLAYLEWFKSNGWIKWYGSKRWVENDKEIKAEQDLWSHLNPMEMIPDFGDS